MEDARKETPRTITIQRSTDGYGFNIRGQTYEGGQIKAIHGKLYAPLQYVSAVTPGSLAEKAGLHVGDMILEMFVMIDFLFDLMRRTSFVSLCSLEEIMRMLKVHHIIKW